MGIQFRTPRFSWLSWLVLLIGTVLAFNASAISTVDIVFTNTTGLGAIGSNSIVAAPGDVLTAVIRVTPGAEGISSYGMSLLFDTDLGDELDLMLATELLPPSFDFNLTPGVASTQESILAVQRGHALTFEAATLGSGPPPPPTFDVAELQFLVTANVATDGSDLFTGLFNPGLDGVFDNDGFDSTVVFGEAAVNVPEPTTAVLMGLGLAGLGLASRKRRSV